MQQGGSRGADDERDRRAGGGGGDRQHLHSGTSRGLQGPGAGGPPGLPRAMRTAGQPPDNTVLGSGMAGLDYGGNTKLFSCFAASSAVRD